MANRCENMALDGKGQRTGRRDDGERRGESSKSGVTGVDGVSAHAKLARGKGGDGGEGEA